MKNRPMTQHTIGDVVSDDKNQPVTRSDRRNDSSRLLGNDELPGMPKRSAQAVGPSVNQTGLFPRFAETNSARLRTRTVDHTVNDDVPRAVLVERAGAEPLTLTLYSDRTLVFGRAADCSVVCPSEAASRLHAQLRFVDDGWLLRDLNSRNGSWLLTRDAGDEDPRASARRIGAVREHRVRTNDVVLLGNGESRLTFLPAVPDEPGEPDSHAMSPATRQLEHRIQVCATHRLPVFLLGPSGVGKTYVARAIHERSRSAGHFVLLNCGRLPHDPAQLASELLGHVKGSFTGATSDRVGRLWSADGGTLFLDEGESLPAVAQNFLIDVLEGSGNFLPWGAPLDARRAPPNVRLISASKVPLARSGLRPDLCQRLAAGELVSLPSLSERADDVPRLVNVFLAKLRDEQRIDARVTPEGLRFLQAQQWPGEIRELESTIKVVVSRTYAALQLDGKRTASIVVDVESLQSYLHERQLGFGVASEPSETAPRKRPSDISRQELERVLAEHGGNKTHAAEALGIAVNTLKARLKTSS